MSEPLTDLRFAVRGLRRRPGFTTVAVLLLAIGIGASSVVLTLARATFGTHPPHVVEPDRLIRVTRTTGEVFAGAVSYPDFTFLRDENHTLTDLAAYDLNPVPVMARAAGTMRQVSAGMVSGEYFAVLGTRPGAGRLLRPEDDRGAGGPRVAVISHDLWSTLFAGRTDVIGAQIALGAEPFTVVGVAPPDFHGATYAEPTPDVWVPLTLQPVLAMGQRSLFERVPDQVDYWLDVIGRLRPGTGVEAARADLGALAARLAGEFGDWNAGVGVRVTGDVRYQPNLRRRLARIMGLLGGATAIILLIACANVALLLLARGAARGREMGIRRSLGAGRGRLVRQVLAEALLLAAAGASVGLVLAVWVGQAVGTVLLDGAAGAYRPDLAVLGLTALVAAGAVLVCGLVPALVVSRPTIASLLTAGAGAAPRAGRLRVGLVVTQVALSLTLVTGAGLLVRSVLAAQRVDLGFDAERRLLLPLNLEREGFTEARGRVFVRDALARLRALPGVEAATLTRMVPFRGGWSTDLEAEGASPPSGERFSSGANAVGPGYFAAMGIPLVDGREFTIADDESAPPVAVVNEALARTIWGDANPIGRVLGRGPTRRFTVVGVVRDAQYYDLGEPPQPQLYLSPLQVYFASLNVLVRTVGDPTDATGAVVAALRGLEPTLVIGAVTTLDDVVDAQLRPFRTLAAVVSAIGVIAVVLAALGLYGVLAYLVAQRTREFGVRLALGARTELVSRAVVLQGLRLAAFGMLTGAAGAWLAARLLSGFLFRVEPHDPLTLILAPLALAGAAVLASWVPARRAGATQPMEALRHE